MLGRIEFVILRTGRSPPAALHHASLRRSCSWLQAGERLLEETFTSPTTCAFRRTRGRLVAAFCVTREIEFQCDAY